MWCSRPRLAKGGCTTSEPMAAEGGCPTCRTERVPLGFRPVELPGSGQEQVPRPLPQAEPVSPQAFMQGLQRLPGPIEAGIAQPAGEPVILDPRPRRDRPSAGDQGVEDLAQGGD